MKSSLPLLMRFHTDDDLPFLFNSQTENLYDSLPFRYINKHIFCTNHAEDMKEVFSISKTLIACLADAPDCIVGSLTYTYDPTILDLLVIHFIYVKQDYRRHGVATDLIHTAHPRFHFTSDYLVATQINRNYPALKRKVRITYDPYLVDRLLEKEHLT